MTLSVTIICCNEEANIGYTLASVSDLADEVILVDSGSTDATLEIAASFGPKVKIFPEPWKGFAPQKNSALAKATGDWVLSLDADESLSPELADEIARVIAMQPANGSPIAYRFPRRNIIFGRWIKHAGYYPDPKVRLMRRGAGLFENRLVHEDLKIESGPIGSLRGDLIHYAHPTLEIYLEHIDRYSSLGARMAVDEGRRSFGVGNIVVAPLLRFIYDYFFRGGFLDGREGLLLHLYHSVYISWKYAKAWELSRGSRDRQD